MISVLDLSATEVLFTHFDPRTEKQTTFAISRLLRWIEMTKPPTHLIPLRQEDATYIRENRGLEPHRLARLQEAKTFEPVIFVHDPEDGTYLLIDGSHRYVEAAARGHAHIHAYLFEPADVEPFLVDAPRLSEERIMSGGSGL